MSSTDVDDDLVAATSRRMAIPPVRRVARIVSHEFKLELALLDDEAILAVVGDLDVATASSFEDCLLDLVHHPLRRVTVNMSATTFIDPTGLRALVAGVREARERAVEFRLASPSRSVLKVLEITGLAQVLPVEFES